MGRIQFERTATKNNDSRVSVLISEFDQAMQSNICQLKEPEFYIVRLTISLEDQIKKDDSSVYLIFRNMHWEQFT
jgi:phenylpyruvate tautomerase PptA (4-oxalocrotonate tautomerase family)